MVASWEDFYFGSRRFKFIGDYLGLHVDMINFLISQIISLILALIFRVYMHPEKVSASVRHWTALSAGLCISYFCFGKQVLLAIFLVVMCYSILSLVPPSASHHLTLFASIAFLSVIHIQRQFYEDGIMVLDITGPLMIMVQKVTSLAYSLHDGLTKKEENMTSLQKSFVIKKCPNALEYFSYLLCFQSVLAGPYFMFTDYQDFIEGTHFMKRCSLQSKNSQEVSLDDNRNSPAVSSVPPFKSGKMILSRSDEPSPTQATLWKILVALISALFTLQIAPIFPITNLADMSFLESCSFFYLVVYILLSTTLIRQMYYTAWLLSDAVCNMSGLGFSGFDKNGNASWDLVSNIDLTGVELGDSFKVTLAAWNIGTVKWLRFLVYERAYYLNTLFTYLLSSLWHGFYPGYYLTFVGGAFFTLVARTVRRSVRHRVLPYGPTAKSCYDLFTFLATRITLSYVAFPFAILKLWPSVYTYGALYCYLHIVGLVIIVFLPVVLPPLKKSNVREPQESDKETKKYL